MGFTILLSGCKPSEKESTDGRTILPEKKRTEVEVRILKRSVFHREIISNGKLKAFKKSDLKFKVGGELKELKLKNGHAVSAGQTIAILDQFEYLQKLEYAEIAVKKSAIELNDVLIAYGGLGIKNDSIPKSIYDAAVIRTGYGSALSDLKTAQVNIGETILKAPFSGKIANIKQNVYELVNTGDIFCTLIDDTNFEVEFYLLESEIGEVALNDRVKIVPFSKDMISEGTVSEINPLVDENGLVLLKAVLPNNGTLWEGMNVKVIIEKKIPDLLIVPKAAVVLRQNQEVLFKFKGGVALWTYIQTGSENSTSYAVTAHPDKGGSLVEGDTIIISNNLNLAHESEVQIGSPRDAL